MTSNPDERHLRAQREAALDPEDPRARLSNSRARRRLGARAWIPPEDWEPALSELPWAELRSSQPALPATAIPNALRDLLSPHEDTREAAYDLLWELLAEGGIRTHAALAAWPFLLGALLTDNLGHLPPLTKGLDLLRAIAFGERPLEPLGLTTPPPQPLPTVLLDNIIDPSNIDASLYHTLAASLPPLLALLDHPRRFDRMEALRLAALLPSARHELTPALRRRWRLADTQPEQTSILLALGMLRSRDDIDLLTAQLSQPDTWLQRAAAQALTLILGPDIPTTALDILEGQALDDSNANLEPGSPFANASPSPIERHNTLTPLLPLAFAHHPLRLARLLLHSGRLNALQDLLTTRPELDTDAIDDLTAALVERLEDLQPLTIGADAWRLADALLAIARLRGPQRIRALRPLLEQAYEHAPEGRDAALRKLDDALKP